MENPIINAIFSRRSIRKFTSEPVSDNEIKLLLQAAMAAPSAVNSQPWEFIVVTEPDGLKKVQDVLPFGRHQAPLGIVVCGNPLKATNPAGQMFWVQDCSAAMENLLLASQGLNLGAVWVGIYPVSVFVSGVRKALHIPRSVTPLGLALIGHPAETRPARTQYREDKVSWQRFGIPGSKPEDD